MDTNKNSSAPDRTNRSAYRTGGPAYRPGGMQHRPAYRTSRPMGTRFPSSGTLRPSGQGSTYSRQAGPTYAAPISAAGQTDNKQAASGASHYSSAGPRPTQRRPYGGARTGSTYRQAGHTPHSRTGGTRSPRSRFPSKTEGFREPSEIVLPRIPALAKGKVRIIPLGGVEEVGKNMTAIEYENDIIVVDAGFQFPEDETPGIDYIIPNTKYLEENRSKIRGLIISHGHMDHIGGIPYLIELLGMPTIYTNKLTAAMVMKRQAEFPHTPKINIEEVSVGKKIKLGALTVRFFDITHTIPDSIGTIIETPLGNILYPGDFKIEVDTKGNPTHVEQFLELGKEKNLVLLMESTNAESPGFSVSESVVQKKLDEIIGGAKGRVIVGTFSSMLERIMDMVKIAEKHGRKVIVNGRSMLQNVEIAKELGYFKPKENTIIPIGEINNYPPEKILAICTGSQGEKEGSLQRIAGKKHKDIKLQKDDMVILSSSIIPGNEKSIQNLKDNLARQGAKIVHYKVADVHASGHAYQEELKLMVKMLKPKFLIPVHGHYFMLKTNADVAEAAGMPRENIAIPFNNGAVIETDGEKIHMLKEMAPSSLVMVDGLGVGDVKEVVLRDRQALAQDGIFVVITAVDAHTGKVKNSPDIISRGFVYLRESQDLLHQTRQLVRKTIEEATGQMNPINMTYVKETLREHISKYLFQKTKRRPMVLPVIIEV